MKSPASGSPQKCCCSCQKDAEETERIIQRLYDLQRENLENKKTILELTQRIGKYKQTLDKCVKHFADLSTSFQNLFQLAHVTSSDTALPAVDGRQANLQLSSGSLGCRRKIPIDPLDIRELVEQVEEEAQLLEEGDAPKKKSLSTILEERSLDSLSPSGRVNRLENVSARKSDSKEAYVKVTRLTQLQPEINSFNTPSTPPMCSSTPNQAQILMLRELALTPTSHVHKTANTPTGFDRFVTKTRGNVVRKDDTLELSPAKKRKVDAKSYVDMSDNFRKSTSKTSFSATNLNETKKVSPAVRRSKRTKGSATPLMTSSSSDSTNSVSNRLSSSDTDLSKTKNGPSTNFGGKLKIPATMTLQNKSNLTNPIAKRSSHESSPKRSVANSTASPKFNGNQSELPRFKGRFISRRSNDQIENVGVNLSKSPRSKEELDLNRGDQNPNMSEKNKKKKSPPRNASRQRSSPSEASDRSIADGGRLSLGSKKRKSEPRVKTMKRAVPGASKRFPKDARPVAERPKLSRAAKPQSLQEPSLSRKLRR